MEQVKESLSVLLMDASDTVGLVLWCVFIGACLAFFSVYKQKMGLGRALQILMDEKAFSPENAISLPQKMIPSSALKGRERMIALVEEEGKTLFYLPEENLDKAQALFKGARTPLWLAFLEMIGLYAVLFIISKVLPLILDGFKNL